jgi:hypothetical protein
VCVIDFAGAPRPRGTMALCAGEVGVRARVGVWRAVAEHRARARARPVHRRVFSFGMGPWRSGFVCVCVIDFAGAPRPRGTMALCAGVTGVRARVGVWWAVATHNTRTRVRACASARALFWDGALAVMVCVCEWCDLAGAPRPRGATFASVRARVAGTCARGLTSHRDPNRVRVVVPLAARARKSTGHAASRARAPRSLRTLQPACACTARAPRAWG